MDEAIVGGTFGTGSIEGLSKDLGDSPALAARRREAFARYLDLPLEPNPLYRQYGYFSGVELQDLDPRARGPAVRVPPAPPGAVQIVHDAAGTRVHRGPGAPGPEQLRVVPIEELWRRSPDAQESFVGSEGAPADRLSALSAALVNRGYRLEVDRRDGDPVRVQDVTLLSQAHEALAVRRDLQLASDARLTLTEEVFATPGEDPAQRLVSSATRVALGPGADATVLSLHAPDPRTVGVYHRRAVVGDRARLTWIWSGFGGFRTKVRNLTELAGNGCAADDLQTFYGDGEQSYDSSIQITHLGMDTHGQSITRGVFRDQARGMSRGLVRIEKDARKTLSYLSEHAMLLSRGARSDTIPILEILCRDVKATHSSSVAPVDPEKVFYLESRGLPAGDAVRMIGEGFLGHVLERSPIPGLREVLYPYLARRWEGGSLLWESTRSQLLPALGPSGGPTEADWRFDAKLR